MSVIKQKKQEIIQPQKMGLLVENPVYKPFRYPWCYDAWLTQQRIHWLPEEVPLGDDVRDWQKNLSQSEKNLLTQIFRFFTQADVEVSNCYLRHYTTVFKPTEVLMMMTAFAAMETVHVAAYSHLLDTIGMPESEYSAFMKYKELKMLMMLNQQILQQMFINQKINNQMNQNMRSVYRVSNKTKKTRDYSTTKNGSIGRKSSL